MGEVYREHFGFVWTLLRRLGVAERDLEDVAHDVFVVVHRRLPQFERRAAVRTWIYAIAVRVAANYRRKRRDEPDPDGNHARGLVAPASSDPEAHALRSSAAAVLDRLLARLDDKKRTVFVLAEIEGLKAPEIARIVGTNPRTVHSRLRAARTRFESDLARLHRHDAAVLGHGPAPASAQWIRDAAPTGHAPAGAQDRVWGALVLSLPSLSAPAGAVTGLGALGWATSLKAIGLSVALGAAALGVLTVATAPLRDASAEADAAAPKVADVSRHAAPGAPSMSSVASAASVPGPNENGPLQGRAAALDHPGEPRGAGASASDARPDAAVPSDASAGAATTHASVSAIEPVPPRSGDGRRGADPAPAAKRGPEAASAGEAATSQDAFVRDVALLDEVRTALADGDPAAALAHADAHARQFPDSRLRLERERSRVAALCALSRPADAREAARRAGVPVGCAAAESDAGT